MDSCKGAINVSHRQVLIGFATVSVAIVVGSGYYWQQRLTPLTTTSVTETNTPTIFIGGDYARAFSTNGFVHRFSETHLMTKALVVHVGKQGQITTRQYAPLRHNPTIQIIYADNHNAKLQAQQLAPVMRVLKQRYHVTKYNVVGHSSGGNIIFDYLTKSSQNGQPRIAKFVTLGSNYPGSQAALKRLPAHLPVLNIGAKLWQTNGDGAVTLHSVLAFSHELKQSGWQPQTKIIHGGLLTATHSMLHINPTVDRDIVQFLYH